MGGLLPDNLKVGPEGRPERLAESLLSGSCVAATVREGLKMSWAAIWIHPLRSPRKCVEGKLSKGRHWIALFRQMQ